MSLNNLLFAAAAFMTVADAAAQSAGVFRDMVDDGRFAVPDEDWSLILPSAAIDAVFFFKNNEYFAPAAEGYTLVGYQLRPTLTWGRDHLAVTGGLQALRYGGMDKMSYVRPFAAVRWRPLWWLALQMGCLPGPASHFIHEVEQDPESQLTEKPELGLQVSLRRPRLSAEAWVNWRKFIFKGDTVPERFTAGIKALFRPGSERAADFSLPASLVFDHIGGQISDYDEPMQSLANVTLSPTLTLWPDSGRFVRAVSFALNAFAFHTMAGSEVRPFDDGWALCPEVALRAKHLEASVGYFHGHDFFAMRGNPLFWSVSNYDASFYEADRDLVTFGASFVTPVTSWGRFSLDFRGYHDVSRSRFDYSYGLTMVLTPRSDLFR